MVSANPVTRARWFALGVIKTKVFVDVNTFVLKFSCSQFLDEKIQIRAGEECHTTNVIKENKTLVLTLLNTFVLIRSMEALKRAVDIMGGQSPLARSIGVEQSHVWNWLNRTNAKVPAERCPAIERATGRQVRCEDLRPDVDWAYLREHIEEPGTPRESVSEVVT